MITSSNLPSFFASLNLPDYSAALAQLNIINVSGLIYTRDTVNKLESVGYTPQQISRILSKLIHIKTQQMQIQFEHVHGSIKDRPGANCLLSIH